MDPERFFDVRQRIRRAGLPDTELYRRAEFERMQYEDARRLRGALERNARQARQAMVGPTRFDMMLRDMGDAGQGPRPRAEPDQVVRQTEKGKDGRRAAAGFNLDGGASSELEVEATNDGSSERVAALFSLMKDDESA